MALPPNDYFNAQLLSPGQRALHGFINDLQIKIEQAFAMLPPPSGIPGSGALGGYTWRAFADSIDGADNFTTSEPGERTHIGLAFNKTVQAPSQFRQDYTWTRIKGQAGANAPALILQYSVDGIGGWHSPYAAGDRFWRQSVDGGLTFTAGARLSAATLAELDLSASLALAAAGTQIALINISLGNMGVTISDEVSARITGDTALGQQIQSLTATVGANNSAFTNNVTTQAGVNSSLASQIGQLTSSVGANTASVTNFGEVINGLQARAGLRLDVNGKITGFVLNNDGQQGSARFDVDNFFIGDGDSPFRVVSGVTYIKEAVIQALTIGTTKLANNATFGASNFYADFGGFRRASPSYNVWYDVEDGFGTDAAVVLTAGPDGLQRVSLDAILTLARDGGDDDNTSWRIMRSDGAALPQVYNNVQISSGRRQYAFAFFDDAIAANATMTYRLQYLALPSDGHPFFHNVSLRGVVNKK